MKFHLHEIGQRLLVIAAEATVSFIEHYLYSTSDPLIPSMKTSPSQGLCSWPNSAKTQCKKISERATIPADAACPRARVNIHHLPLT